MFLLSEIQVQTTSIVRWLVFVAPSHGNSETDDKYLPKKALSLRGILIVAAFMVCATGAVAQDSCVLPDGASAAVCFAKENFYFDPCSKEVTVSFAILRAEPIKPY